MPAEARDRRVFGLERLVFFSDAVFAIAITLLVIDLRLPDLGDHVSNQQLSAALGALVPRIFAYALSFWVIGLYWLAHWRRYQYIERVDETLIALNLLLLGLVAFMPFPTALVGEYLLTDHAAPAVVIYNSVTAVQAIGWILVSEAALRNRLAKDEKSTVLVRDSHRSGYVALGVYSLLALIAVWFPLTVAIVTTMLWAYWLTFSLRAD